MYQTYKPSGKYSTAFYPLFIITSLLVVPAISYLSVLFNWFLPSTLVDIVTYIIFLIFLALLSSKYCIKLGKVRNRKIACWSAFLIFLWFSYLSIVFFYCLYSHQNEFSEIVSAFLDPQALMDYLKLQMAQGYTVETMKNGTLFEFTGPLIGVLWGVKFLLSLCYLMFFLSDDSKQPFCELSNKWATKYEFQLEAIPDMAEYKKQLFFGNTAKLREMESLKTVNSNHTEAELYMAEGDSSFFITLINQTRKGDPDRSGNVKFEAEEFIEFLAIDHDTGNQLLQQGLRQDIPATARIVSSKLQSEQRFNFIKMVLLSLIQIVLLAIIISDRDRLLEAFSSTAALSYFFFNIFIWGVDLWAAFQEDVFVDEEHNIYGNGIVRSWQVLKQTQPAYYKIFYFFMFFVSLFLLLYSLKEILL